MLILVKLLDATRPAYGGTVVKLNATRAELPSDRDGCTLENYRLWAALPGVQVGDQVALPGLVRCSRSACGVDIPPGAERYHRDTGAPYCPTCARTINAACGQELVVRASATPALPPDAERAAKRLRACPYIMDADRDDCRGFPIRWRVRDGRVEVAGPDRDEFHPVTEAGAAVIVAGVSARAEAYNAALADGDQHLAAEQYAHLETDYPSDAAGQL